MAIYRNNVKSCDDVNETSDGAANADSLDLTVEIASALSDATRVRILMALVNCRPCCDSGTRELCACQIVYLIGLAQSTVSKHISILKQVGLITSRKTGRWIYFRLADEGASQAVRDAMEWLKRNLSNDTQIAEDRKKLAEITSLEVEEVCRVCLRN